MTTDELNRFKERINLRLVDSGDAAEILFEYELLKKKSEISTAKCFDCKRLIWIVEEGTRCFHCPARPWYCWDCARKHFTPVMPHEVHG